MDKRQTDRLVKLGDSDLTVADPREDIRDRKVIDRAGDDIGHVSALLIDDADKKVRFLEVAAGGFLGIGERTFLLPVDAIVRMDNERVFVDQTRERIVGSPAYDPSLAVDENDYEGMYGYYGYAPYWAPGYTYPGYPTYVM